LICSSQVFSELSIS